MRERIIHFKKFLLFFIIATSYLSCKTNLLNVSSDNQIHTKKIVIKSQKLYVTILLCKKEFNEKYGKLPENIILEFNQDSKKRFMTVTVSSDLYTNVDDKNIFNDSFIGGLYVENTVVLLRNNLKFYDSKLIKITDEAKIFTIDYGNNLDSCDYSFQVKDDNFQIMDQYCSFDYYVD